MTMTTAIDDNNNPYFTPPPDYDPATDSPPATYNGAPALPALDHIILLLPSPALLSNPPPSLAKAFTISPGGHHADALTANALIPLRSGSYIELVAFSPSCPPAARAAHWWARARPGWIDWALWTPGLGLHAVRTAAAALQNHAVTVPGTASASGTGTLWPPTFAPQRLAGGRTRPDGRTCRWRVWFARAELGRGAVPFLCQDATARGLRVPGAEEATRHGSGAVGIAAVRMVAGTGDAVRRYAAAYAGLFGADEDEGVEAVVVGGGKGAVEFAVRMPAAEVGGPEMAWVVVGLPRGEEERRRLDAADEAVVIADVTFLVEGEGEVPETIEEVLDGECVPFRFMSLANGPILQQLITQSGGVRWEFKKGLDEQERRKLRLTLNLPAPPSQTE